MSEALYHYTTVRHLRRILATGVLKPHTSTIVPTALVWASADAVWEPSCALGLWNGASPLSFYQYESLYGAARIALSMEEVPLCWAALRPMVDQRYVAYAKMVGRHWWQGQRHKWHASRHALPRDCWYGVEVWREWRRRSLQREAWQRV